MRILSHDESFHEKSRGVPQLSVGDLFQETDELFLLPAGEFPIICDTCW